MTALKTKCNKMSENKQWKKPGFFMIFSCHVCFILFPCKQGTPPASQIKQNWGQKPWFFSTVSKVRTSNAWEDRTFGRYCQPESRDSWPSIQHAQALELGHRYYCGNYCGHKLKSIGSVPRIMIQHHPNIIQPHSWIRLHVFPPHRLWP